MYPIQNDMWLCNALFNSDEVGNYFDDHLFIFDLIN